MSDRSLRVAIFEPEPRGHHLSLYGKLIIGEALSRGWKVHLVTSKRATEHSSYAMLKAEFGDKFTTSLMDDVVNDEMGSNLTKIKQQFMRWTAFRAGYQSMLGSFQPDVVFGVSLEKIDLPCAFRGSPFGKTPFAGVLLIRYFHCPHMGIKTEPLSKRDQLMGWVFKRLLRISNLKKLMVIDPTLADYPRQFGIPHAEKVTYVPDASSFSAPIPVESPRAALGVPSDKFVILNYGALSHRKGVLEGIAGLAHPSCPQNVALLLAGKQDEDIEEVLRGEIAAKLIAAGRLFVLNHYLSELEESTVFQACDAVWLGYKKFYGMSGVLVQTASSGKPCLAMDQGLVGHLVKTNGLGLTVEISDPAAVAGAMKTLAKADHDEYAARGRAFAANHAPHLFGQRVCDLITEAAGQPRPS